MLKIQYFFYTFFGNGRNVQLSKTNRSGVWNSESFKQYFHVLDALFKKLREVNHVYGVKVRFISI